MLPLGHEKKGGEELFLAELPEDWRTPRTVMWQDILGLVRCGGGTLMSGMSDGKISQQDSGEMGAMIPGSPIPQDGWWVSDVSVNSCSWGRSSEGTPPWDIEASNQQSRPLGAGRRVRSTTPGAKPQKTTGVAGATGSPHIQQRTSWEVASYSSGDFAASR